MDELSVTRLFEEIGLGEVVTTRAYVTWLIGGRLIGSTVIPVDRPLAQEWLAERNLGNRKLMRDPVTDYAAQFEQGRWRLSSQAGKRERIPTIVG